MVESTNLKSAGNRNNYHYTPIQKFEGCEWYGVYTTVPKCLKNFPSSDFFPIIQFLPYSQVESFSHRIDATRKRYIACLLWIVPNCAREVASSGDRAKIGEIRAGPYRGPPRSHTQNHPEKITVQLHLATWGPNRCTIERYSNYVLLISLNGQTAAVFSDVAR